MRQLTNSRHILLPKDLYKHDGLLEFFSPIAHINSIQVLLPVNKDLANFQLNVKSTFLYGNLHDCVHGGETKKVDKLRKVIYGLKQSPCASFEKFNQTMTSIGKTLPGVWQITLCLLDRD